MNQDFVLPATPAAARQLCRIADIVGMNFDPAIRELAERDRLVSPDGEPVDNLIQNIADRDFRAVVPFHTFSPFVEFIRRLQVVTKRFQRIVVIAPDAYVTMWRSHHEELEIENPTGAQFSFFAVAETFLETVPEDAYADTLLVFIDEYWSGCAAGMREFPHAIQGIFAPDTDNVDGIENKVFPAFRLGSANRALADEPIKLAEELEPRGFAVFHRHQLAFLQGIETDLIRDAGHKPVDYEIYNDRIRQTARGLRTRRERTQQFMRKSYPDVNITVT